MYWKSIDFVKQRILDPENDFDIQNTDELTVIRPQDILGYGGFGTTGFVDGMVTGEYEGQRITIYNHFKYNPEADFDYVTSVRGLNDGTLIFKLELMSKCLQQLQVCSTYDKRKGLPKLKNNCHIYYTFGDLVISSEIRHDLAPKNEPWCCNQVYVMLPITYDFKEGDS